MSFEAGDRLGDMDLHIDSPGRNSESAAQPGRARDRDVTL
jgi:hypothetical protein